MIRWSWNDRASERTRGLKSTLDIRDGICFLTLSGEYDRSNVRGLRADIRSCLAQAPSVVLDFGAVSFVNGAVMTLLRNTIDDLPAGGWVGVARPSAEIARLFAVAGLTDQPKFRLFPTVADVGDPEVSG
jgi:anti-anti-sigma factor